MEQVYALGVSCIEFIQCWCEDWAGYFEIVNHLSNPRYVMEFLFPLISILDSVFASQLLLCMAFGSLMNSIMKWMLLEDRPFWWVKETSYYTVPPLLQQTDQTCETGPGCPSGHTCAASMILVLIVMWGQHIFNDRKWYPWWKHAVYPLFAVSIVSVMLARLFVATHFPHQCLMGAMMGLFLAPALCIYVSDPFIWRYGPHAHVSVSTGVWRHVCGAGVATFVAVAVYCILILYGVDPHYTVKLAFRWCKFPDSIQVSTTPLYSVMQSAAALLGLALTLTPAVDRYRHNTKNRSLLISIFASGLTILAFKQLEQNIPSSSAFRFYLLQFISNAVKPAFFLRLVPALSLWPYSGQIKEKTS